MMHMTSYERVKAVLAQKPVDRFPRHLWTLPGVNEYRKVELEKLQKSYPGDIRGPNVQYGTDARARGTRNRIGTYCDAWGCVWRMLEPGVVGEVEKSPIESLDDVDDYRLPYALIREADFSKVNDSCAKSDQYILAGTETRPFERMQFLRGTENLMMDLAYDEPRIYRLRDRLHAFFMEEMQMWAKTDVDGVSFMDDWGTNTALLIDPEIWRAFFKPLYRDYCDLLHSYGKDVFFHSDGHIEAIYPDLIEIGVDACNSQLFCMDIERIGRLYAGKLVFWGEMDRQHILPFATPMEVRQAVRRVASALTPHGHTGLIAQCEWGNQDPYENIEAVFDEWNRITAKEARYE